MPGGGNDPFEDESDEETEGEDDDEEESDEEDTDEENEKRKPPKKEKEKEKEEDGKKEDPGKDKKPELPSGKTPVWKKGKRPAHQGLFGAVRDDRGGIGGCQYTLTTMQNKDGTIPDPAKNQGCHAATAGHCVKLNHPGQTQGTVNLALWDPRLGTSPAQGPGAGSGKMTRTPFFRAKVLVHPAFQRSQGSAAGWADVAVMRLPASACRKLKHVPRFPICRPNELPKSSQFRAVSFCIHQTDQMGRKAPKAIAVDVYRRGPYGFNVRNYGRAWKPGTSGGGVFYRRKNGEPCLFAVASTSSMRDEDPSGSAGSGLGFLDKAHRKGGQFTASAEPDDADFGEVSLVPIDVGEVIPPIRGPFVTPWEGIPPHASQRERKTHSPKSDGRE